MKITSLLPSALTLLLSTNLALAVTPPNAGQILRGMSAKLSAAQQFSYHAEREIDPELLEGRDLAEKASVDLNVSRPSQLAARSVSSERTMRFIADGKNLTIVNVTKNHYAQVPMATTIDGLVARLDATYGFVPPLADFAVSDPYQEIRRQADTVTYLGREKLGAGFLGLGGVECHHLGLKGKIADADLWIAVKDELPRKLVATFKEPASHPQVRIVFSSWNLAAPMPATEFTFTPPIGAEKIEMWTPARMAANAKK